MADIKRYFRTMGTLIKATPVIIVFEIMFKLILFAIVSPLLKFMLNTSMKLAGVNYLTSDNLKKFFSDPITFLFAFIIITGASFILLIEISAIINCFAVFSRKKRIGVAGMMKAGVLTAAKSFRSIKNFPIFIHTFFILIFTQLAATSGLFSYVGLPNLQTLAGIPTETMFSMVYLVGLAVFTFFFITRMYSLPLFVLTDMKYSECLKISKQTTSKRRLKLSVKFILWNILLALLCAVLIFSISFITLYVAKGFSQAKSAASFGIKCMENIMTTVIICSVIFSVPMLVLYIAASFFTEKNDIRRKEITIPETRVKPVVVRIASAVIIVASLILNYSYLSNTSDIRVDMRLFRRTQITAHRGASADAPENTLHSFEKAIELGADYIELDVQQTADGQLVVFHDKNLKRTTGMDALLSEKTYEEISSLDCGGWFSEDFKDTPIMLFSDALDYTKDKIKLNVEIKKCDNITEVARNIAATIEEYDCVKDCYVTSFSYQALKAVKEVNPSIKTGIISNVMTYNSYTKLKHIDAISLNKLFATQNIVNMAHANGKKIFVWTVNDSYEIDKYLTMGVDNIITDSPDTALECVYSKGAEGYVVSILSWLFNF